MTDIDKIAEEITRLGLAKADELEAQAARMRELLAAPGFVQARAEAQLRAAFPWEAEVPPATSEPWKIWAAQAFSFATGEGLTSLLFGTYAGDEAQFRRALSARVGRDLANAAVIYEPFRELLERTWATEPRGMRSVFIQSHVNYS